MPDVFVSYRRADSTSAAGRLCDRLIEHVGADRVFRDVESIEAGEDFNLAIRDALHAAALVLVVIGPRWVSARTPDGRRRLDEPDDYVRREIEIALRSDALVIPVLVEGARLPAPEELPEPLHPLVLRQAVELTDRRWNDDMRGLMARIGEALAVSGSSPALIADGRAGSTQSPQLANIGREVAEFVGDLFALVSSPRRFLARRARGTMADLLEVAVFFAVAVVLSIAMVITVYWPRGPIAGFFLSGLLLTAIAALVVSAPLWLSDRLVGARRHYRRLIVILLYQVAVVHLLLFVALTVVLTILEARSAGIMTGLMDKALAPGASAIEELDAYARSAGALANRTTVMASAVAASLPIAAALAWLTRSWAAYRDALELGRARGIFGSVLFLILVVSAVALVLALAA